MTYALFLRLVGIVHAVLQGYAQVYFAKKWYVGLIFCLATFIIPYQGVAGLGSMVLANLFAFLLGFAREHIREGYFAYNGLLTGLALGLTYEWNKAFVVMLAIAALLGVMVAAVVRALNERYFFVPVLSIPFLLTSWIVIAAGQKFQGLIFTTKPFEVELLNGFFPPFLEFMFRSLGAAFFQLNIPAGLLVSLGIFIFSRQAFMLATLSLFAGSYFHLFLGGNMSDLQGHWIGFNFALTAIAVGGMFVVPGIAAYLLAVAAAFLVAIITAGSSIILSPLGLPVLAFPFLATTTGILYALKNRISPRFLETIVLPADSPEKNFRQAKNKRTRFASEEYPAFELPVSGEWTVTQGFNGDYTHQKLWAYAWDLEVIDEEGKKYREDSRRLSDYYAWNMPLFAPADGKVVRVVNHIEDNAVGQMDTKNNWGNTIVIWHYGSVYTALSHLVKGSIAVNEGEMIRRGQCVGKVGNSGRSTCPHLHFQVQYSPEVGSPTARSEILHYVSKENHDWFYHTQGVPANNHIIKAVESDISMPDAASFPFGQRWQFLVTDGKRKWQETWETEVDFFGKRFLVCREKNARLQFFASNRFLLLMDYEGTHRAALRWFFLAVPRLPFTMQDVTWREEMPVGIILGFCRRALLDILEPFYPFVKLVTCSRFVHDDHQQIKIKTSLALQGLWSHRNISQTEVVSVFERYLGLTSLKVTSGHKTLLEMEQITENGNAHNQ
jgi:urea transporter